MAKIKITLYDPKEGKFVLDQSKKDRYTLEQIALIKEIETLLGGREIASHYESLKKQEAAWKHQVAKNGKFEMANNELKEKIKSIGIEIKKIEGPAKGFLELEKIYADPDLSVEKISYFKELMNTHLSPDVLKIVFNSKFSLAQMNVVAKGFISGLSEDEVKIYAKKDFDTYQMNFLLKNLVDGVHQDLVRAVADPKYPVYEMEAMMDNILSEKELLTEEGVLAALAMKQRENELKQLAEVNIEFDSETKKFSIDGKEIDLANLSKLVSFSAEPKYFDQRKALYLNPEVTLEKRGIADTAITLEYPNEVIKKIIDAPSTEEARNILTSKYKEQFGEDAAVRFDDKVYYSLKPKTQGFTIQVDDEEDDEIIMN